MTDEQLAATVEAARREYSDSLIWWWSDDSRETAWCTLVAAVEARALAQWEQGCAAEDCGHAGSEHDPGIPNEDDTGRLWAGCRACIADAADESAVWHAFESRNDRLRQQPATQDW